MAPNGAFMKKVHCILINWLILTETQNAYFNTITITLLLYCVSTCMYAVFQ